MQNFCFIGNSQNDNDAAKQAGGYSIILAKNPLSKKYKPDFFISTLSDIPALVNSLNLR